MGTILWGRGWGKNILDKGNKVSKTSEEKKKGCMAYLQNPNNLCICRVGHMMESEGAKQASVRPSLNKFGKD